MPMFLTFSSSFMVLPFLAVTAAPFLPARRAAAFSPRAMVRGCRSVPDARGHG